MTLTRERVEATPRGSMHPARRRRIWERDNGKCGGCGCDVPLNGTVVDHSIALHHGGPEDDRYCRFLCPGCDAPKTANDQSISGHIRRLIKKNDPATRKPPQMRSAPFQTRLTKRVNGKVTPRNPRPGQSPANNGARHART